MNTFDPILWRELPIIQKIIQDETWLEGERRGCHVRPDDGVVRENVCQIILRIGHQLRESLSASIGSMGTAGTAMAEPASVTHLPLSDPDEAA